MHHWAQYHLITIIQKPHEIILIGFIPEIHIYVYYRLKNKTVNILIDGNDEYVLYNFAKHDMLSFVSIDIDKSKKWLILNTRNLVIVYFLKPLKKVYQFDKSYLGRFVLNGEAILIVGFRNFRIIDLYDGTLIKQMGNFEKDFVGDSEYIRVKDVKVSENGHLIITSHDSGEGTHSISYMDRVLRGWDLISEKQRFVLDGHTAWINDFEFLPGGQKIVTCSYDRSVKLWDIASENCKTTMYFNTVQKKIIVHPDGKNIICGKDLDHSSIQNGKPEYSDLFFLGIEDGYK